MEKHCEMIKQGKGMRQGVCVQFYRVVKNTYIPEVLEKWLQAYKYLLLLQRTWGG